MSSARVLIRDLLFRVGDLMCSDHIPECTLPVPCRRGGDGSGDRRTRIAKNDVGLCPRRGVRGKVGTEEGDPGAESVSARLSWIPGTPSAGCLCMSRCFAEVATDHLSEPLEMEVPDSVSVGDLGHRRRNCPVRTSSTMKS